jgi:putative flippase GtrA
LGAAVGFVVGTIVSYLGNSYFVFRQTLSGSNFSKFWLVTLFGLAMNLLLASVLERMGSPPLLTAFVIFATVPLLNYAGHRLWTFKAVKIEDKTCLR